MKYGKFSFVTICRLKNKRIMLSKAKFFRANQEIPLWTKNDQKLWENLF